MVIESLEKRISKIKELSSLPVVVNNVIQIIQNPKASALKVGEAISQDPSLAANVLRMVNSAFYGFPRKITTITHAILVLGFVNVRNVVLTTSIFNILSTPARDNRFDIQGFWKHSVACGVACKVMARRLGMSNLEEAFLWGLMHDLGKLIFYKYFYEDYVRVTALVREKGILIRDAEKEILGVDHTFLGFLVGNRWNLPNPLLKAIKFHHNPTSALESKRIVALVHAADILCRAVGMGNAGDARVPMANPACWKLLGLDKNAVKKIFLEMDKEMILAGSFLAFM